MVGHKTSDILGKFSTPKHFPLENRQILYWYSIFSYYIIINPNPVQLEPWLIDDCLISISLNWYIISNNLI